jgi:hypothetical protein
MNLKFLACMLALAASLVAQTPAKPPAQTTPAQATPAKPDAKPEGKPEAKPAPAEVKPDEVVLWIGSEPITRERFEALLKAVPPQFAQSASQMGKKQFASQYGMLIGLARTAEKEKMDQTPLFKDQLDFMRLQFMAQMAFQQISQRNQVVTDDQVKMYYEAHQGEYQQASVRGIYVGLNPPKGKDGSIPKGRTEEEAKALAQKLHDKVVAGADFAAVAKESSEDDNTAAKGGDLGTVRRGQLPPNIEKAVFSLKPKEVSQPVAEATGFYIFELEDLRSTTLPEATPQIRQKLTEAATINTLDKVKADYPVKFNDNYFAEPAPNPLAPAKP